MKICKNGDFRHISGIFGRKRIFFSKIGLGHDLRIANAHLYRKNQKKLMVKSRENAQKPVFPEYSAGNEFFSKIGLRHIFGITILHLCAKNQEKLISQSREKLVTNGRTNEHRLIYRTSEVGPKIFAQDGVSLAEQNIDFRKIFVKASSSQNLENSGF